MERRLSWGRRLKAAPSHCWSQPREARGSGAGWPVPSFFQLRRRLQDLVAVLRRHDPARKAAAEAGVRPSVLVAAALPQGRPNVPFDEVQMAEVERPQEVS